MAFSPVRRQRRRRTVVVVLVVVSVILGTAYAVTRAQSDRQLRREYLDLAAEVAAGEEDAAVRFSDMVVRLDELSRPAVVELLGEIEESVVDLSRRLESADPPSGRLERAHVFFAVAAQKWKDGVLDTRNGIETLSESPLDPDGLAALAAGLIHLRVGDGAYAEFQALALEVDTDDVGREYPEVAFVPEESELLFEATDIARRIFLTPDLGVVRNLAVADIKLDPSPIGDQEGVPVVPLSETLAAEVTVSNRGTIDEIGIVVELDLISSDGSQVTFDQEIEMIGPDALTSITFEDLPVEPGGLYELAAALPGGDDDSSDDVATLVFIRNDES
jgi:hypothetical protein